MHRSNFEVEKVCQETGIQAPKNVSYIFFMSEGMNLAVVLLYVYHRAIIHELRSTIRKHLFAYIESAISSVYETLNEMQRFFGRSAV